MKTFRNFIRTAILVASVGTAFTTLAATLKEGDPAPRLEVSKWVQGDAVTNFEAGKLYIVEFWATWCGPCRQTIPHLNQIHNKFKDQGLIVIGQDVWEHSPAKVAPFVSSMGTNMTYRVAMDVCPETDPNSGKMAQNWMRAADQNGIPCAFIVTKEGKIGWIGHPATLTEGMVQEMLDNKFDFKAVAEKQQSAREQDKKFNDLYRQFSKSLREKDYDQAETALNNLEKNLPESQRSGLRQNRLRILMGKGQNDAVSQLAKEIVGTSRDNPQLLNDVAWTLLTSDAKERNLDLAEEFALRANELTKGNNPGVLDTLARAEFLLGKHEKAIDLQNEAINKAQDEDEKAQLRKILERYKEGSSTPQ